MAFTYPQQPQPYQQAQQYQQGPPAQPLQTLAQIYGTASNAHIASPLPIPQSAPPAFSSSFLQLHQQQQHQQYGQQQYQQSQPAYGQSQPAYGQSQPAYGQSQPAYGQSQPAYGQSQPAYGQSQPAYGQSQPAYGQSQPAYGQSQQYQTQYGQQQQGQQKQGQQQKQQYGRQQQYGQQQYGQQQYGQQQYGQQQYVPASTQSAQQTQQKRQQQKQQNLQQQPRNKPAPNQQAQSDPSLALGLVVLPVDGQWFCEACDKEFTQLSAYTAHIAAHEKCHHPGCNFEGTQKTVSAHYLSTHGTYSGNGFTNIEVEGQTFRVLMGTSPEDVQQWRADRRKHFPTAATVQAKKEHQDELRSAGGLPSKQGNGKNARGQKKGRQQNGVRALQATTTGSQQQKGDGGLLCTDTGTANEAAGSNIASGNTPTEAVGDGAVASSEVLTASSHQNKAKKRPREPRNQDNQQATKKQQKGGLHVPHPLTGGSRGTLMKKLLEDEIAVEENVLLQCFHFFVEQHFFHQ